MQQQTDSDVDTTEMDREDLAAMGHAALSRAVVQRELWQIQRDAWIGRPTDNIHKLMADARQAWLAAAAEAGACFAAASYGLAAAQRDQDNEGKADGGDDG